MKVIYNNAEVSNNIRDYKHFFLSKEQLIFIENLEFLIVFLSILYSQI